MCAIYLIEWVIQTIWLVSRPIRHDTLRSVRLAYCHTAVDHRYHHRAAAQIRLNRRSTNALVLGSIIYRYFNSNHTNACTHYLHFTKLTFNKLNANNLIRYWNKYSVLCDKMSFSSIIDEWKMWIGHFFFFETDFKQLMCIRLSASPSNCHTWTMGFVILLRLFKLIHYILNCDVMNF